MEGLRLADAGEAEVLQPAGEDAPDVGAGFGVVPGPRGPRRQVGPQPVEGLLAEATAFPVVQFAGVLSLAGGSQRSGTSGVVAVPLD